MAENPLFFLHFPRTAGTTVDDIFFANFSPDEIIKIYSQEEFAKYRFIDSGQLDKIKYITGHLILDSVSPPKFYSRPVRAFTFLRHPVKRLVSEYIFLKTWKKNHLYNYLNSENISFGEYITSDAKLLKYRGKNFMTRCISGMSLENADPEEVLETAKKNLVENLFFFGIQEYFMESLLLLADRAGIANILHQRHNSLNMAKIDIPITDEDKKLAAERNDLDLKLYDFAVAAFLEEVEKAGPDFQKRLKNFRFLNSKYQRVAELLYEKTDASRIDEPIHIPKEANW